jgi:hypothetical protein
MADRYDIDRDRDRERERERGRRHEDWDRDRERYGEARYEDANRERRGGDEGWRDRGDWGSSGRWGAYGNRVDYDRENTWRESRDSGPHLPYTPESDFGGQRSGRTHLYGTGGGGFGSGFSSYGAGTGPYTGGMGSYGERSYGERQRGQYAGRGPKGWKRSDERIREDINERLTDHPDIDATELDVQVRDGEVTLTGTVDERHMKRLAEDIAESVSGVRELHNNIRVQHGQSQDLTTQGVMENRGSTGTTGRSK